MDAVDRWSKTVVGRRDWAQGGGEAKVTINQRRYLTRVIARDRLSSCLIEELREKHPEVTVDFSVECSRLSFAEAAEGARRPATLHLQRCRPPAGTEAPQEEGCDVADGAGPFEAQADVVIGADGVASAVRAALAEAGARTAHERFEDRRPIVYRVLSIPVPEGERTDLNYSARNDGIIVEALPNVEGALLGVVLFKPTDERVQGLSTGADAKALFSELFPEWPAPLISDEEWEAFVRRRTRQLPQFAYAGPELSLGGSACILGDAIHSVKPFFGLGLNSGFEDIVVLDACLEEAGGDFSKALPLYSQRRAPEAKCMVQCQRRFDQPTDLRFALAFVLPLVLDGIFHKMLPSVFAPGILALFQDGALSFTQARRRKRRDRAGQVAVLAAGAAAAGAASFAAVRGVVFLVRAALLA